VRKALISLTLVALGLTMAVAIVGAQDTPATTPGETTPAFDWRKWNEGPEGFLLTKDEKKEWKQITNEADAKRFIDLFWARRNPMPDQPFNPFKAQIEAIIRYADANYSYEGVRGALTDRGRVMILMGQPHYVENRAPTETVQRMDDSAAGTDEVRANAQVWYYDPQQLDEKYKIKGSRLVFVFYEDKAGSNNFILDRSHQDATMGMRALARAPEAHLLHPKLTEVPKPVSVPGAVAASAASLALLEQPGQWTDKAKVLSEAGVADTAHRPWWIHIELPPDAPALDTLAGRVTTPAGEVLSTFEKPAEPISFGGHSGYHLSFPLAVGSYRIDVVGIAKGAAAVVEHEDVTVPEAPAEGTWMSQIYVGLYGEKKDDAMLGSAYCFGQLHVLPITGPEVTRANELSYFGFVVRPAQVENNQAQLQSRAQLKKDGKRLGRPLEMPLTAVRVAPDLFVYANSINLAALPEPGEYSIVFEVTDPGSETTAEREVPLNITD
jgi:GWxTD domain-containing protein